MISTRYFRSVLVLLILVASHVTDIQGYHHIKLRHNRHRRQHGESYVPGSYVLDNEKPEYGSWGPWSHPSACSKTCGGGVAFQTRVCLDRDDYDNERCTGAKKRYFSCNIQSCPGEQKDFRAEQCAEFNNKPFEGVYYEWIPYTGGHNKCELNCMPRGEKFFFKHREKVIDGTLCNIEKNDVCVEGKCMPVGCDRMLGSDAKEDACRECGGDGSDCNTVKGIFDSNHLQGGYYDILYIPQGATNVVVRETQPSNNYLAIRNSSGYYHLNGNWRIDFPRSLRFAGTIFHYSRDPQGFSAPDTIKALGPTSEPLYIVLLYQDHNVGVEYQYSIPKKFSQQTDPDSYTWVVEEFSSCSATCGGGYQSRRVSCVKRGTNEVADEKLCDPMLEPVDTQACGDEPCPAQWVEGEWTPCSKQCGEGGEQTRDIKCERVVAGGIATIVDEAQCVDSLGPKNATKRECNKDVDCPIWHLGPWKPCDHLCGEGKQTRKVTCYRKNDEGKIEVLEDSACEGEIPEKEKTCELRPCEGVDWVTSPWSGCSEKCGLTQETRTVQCTTVNGTVYPDDMCDDKKKPETTKDCKTPQICEYQWIKTQWSQCSANCGTGVQTRKVFCATFENEDTMKKVPDSKCEPEEKFNTTRECTADNKNCGGEWFAGPWSKCSKPCGGGESTRKVICVKDDKTVTSNQCDYKTLMEETEACNTQACEEDEVIPVEPEKVTALMEDEEEECEDEEDFVTVASSFETSESEKSSDMTEALPLSSPFSSSGNTLEDMMFSDAASRGDVSIPTDSGSGYSSTDEDLDSFPIITTLEGSGTSPDEFEMETAIFDLSTSEVTKSTEVSEINEGSGTTELDFSTTEESTTISGITESSTDGMTNEVTDQSVGFTEHSSLIPTEQTTQLTEETSVESSTSYTTENTDMTTDSSSTESSSDSTETTSNAPNSESTDANDFTPITESTETTSDSSISTDSSTRESEVTDTTIESSTTESSYDSSTSSNEMTTEVSNSETTESSESTESVTSESRASAISEETEVTESSAIVETSESSTMSGETQTMESTEFSVTESGATETGATETGSTETGSTETGATETGATETGATETGATETGVTETGATETGATETGATVTGATETGATETGAIETGEVTETGVTGETTESGMTSESVETEVSTYSTVSGTEETTETEISSFTEETEMTEKSHITDLFTTIGSVEKAITQEHKLRKCKPKKKKTCQTSEFGCCFDGITPAQGPFSKGCPVAHTCKETKYGCCPDGVSAAKGPKNEKCPDQHCKETLFGCCPDGVTPAEGNDFEGCKIPCNETEFGCCPDKETPASGKDNLGCCNGTKFGCCPDGIKAASGPDGKDCEEEAVQVTETTVETTTIAPEDCANSTYGCCPDGQRIANGTNFEGCDIINTKNCTASYFGCCPDNVTAALGPNNTGCRMPCDNTTYGCCDDRTTPAHGSKKEGCCLSSQFKCCPDNITPARGPDFYGCGCQYTKFRCCPDNTTAARGPNNEGCGCQYTPHGCCPNRFTPATGPNFAGCPCYTYQFGCCPDGVTIAKGPHGQGCGCENTEFKCCSDERTPAKGPNFAGCTCDASKYGCCLDGVEEAQGDNFEGCLKVPSIPGAACALPRDRGTCRDFTVKWFYDSEYGGCSKFWYGGCEGNNNRFKTQEECKATCVEPKGKDVCYLPSSSGPCNGYNPMWYYDAERKQCGQFIYSGCLGNSNKFKTRKECEDRCAERVDADPCTLPNEPGPCEGNFTRWYFNKDTHNCETFKYGGCKGNTNNYPSELACRQQCLQLGRSQVIKDICGLEKEPGPCPGSLLRWHYDADRRACKKFIYGGCKGNGNKFRTKAACEQRCLAREQDICLLPALIGECSNYTQRWYYDSYEQRCRIFYYGGCGGNDNNFHLEYDCQNRCEHTMNTPVTPELVFKTEFCFLPEQRGPCQNYQTKWFYDNREGICKQFVYGGCSSNGNNFNSREECEYRCGEVQDPCTMPMLVGPCNGSVPQFYYDRQADACYEFDYSGCQGNKNRFNDLRTCEHRCRKRPPAPMTPPSTHVTPASSAHSQACLEPVETGPCDGEITAYFYDKDSGKCQAFIYGGCEGNANRYETEEQCERLCGRFREQDICHLSMDTGPCRGSFLKFHYDPQSRVCREFTYGGCDGNANRFSTRNECESVCIHHEEPPQTGNKTGLSDLKINTIPDNEQGVEDPCAEATDHCNQLNCPYGQENYVDSQNCRRCRCAEPCQSITCPEGTKCAVALVGYNDVPEYRGVCNPVNKPGKCPVVSNSTRCDQECTSDADCGGEQKCCNSGCGTSCLNPASEEITTTDSAPYQYAQKAIPPGALPPQIQQPESPNVSAEEGSYVTMQCIVIGAPKPVIVWKKDARIIELNESRRRILDNGSLQIINLYPDDKGIYICTADNGIGSPVRIEYQLDVVAPVRINITKSQGQFLEGGPLSLLCIANGIPAPRVTWYKNDIPIQTNDRIRISETNELTISPAYSNDTGTYRCEGVNQHSSNSESVDIHVAGMYIDPLCQDQGRFANCSLIVSAKFCNHKYYAKFCCRSCTKAGQLSPLAPLYNQRSKRSIFSFL